MPVWPTLREEPYPLDVALRDALESSVAVNQLCAGHQGVQGIELRAVAHAAVHEGHNTENKTYFYISILIIQINKNLSVLTHKLYL